MNFEDLGQCDEKWRKRRHFGETSVFKCDTSCRVSGLDSQAMNITFTRAQRQAVRHWAERHASAEVRESTLPSGYSLIIDVAPPFGAIARAVSQAGELEVGCGVISFHALNMGAARHDPHWP